MSRRDFKLRSVLDARKRDLDSARGHLANELREENLERQGQSLLRTRLEDTAEQLHERLTHGSSAGMLPTVGDAMQATYHELQLGQQKAVARTESVEEARARLIDARKKLRSLEILEERWRANERRERAKSDQKRLDDIRIPQPGAGSS